MIFEEKTLSSEYAFRGKLINVRVDRVTTVDGESIREIAEHCAGAAMVALLPDGRIPMVRQYRKAVEQVVFERPAGKADPGEDPLVTAGRELKEETGYSAENIRLLAPMMPSPGFTDEVVYIYLCTGLNSGEQSLDANEALDVEYHDIWELSDMCMRGEIPDAKTQIGILMTRALVDSGELDEYIG